MNTSLQELLEDFGIEQPQEINHLTLYDIVNKVADKWQEMKANKDKLEEVRFEACCPNKDLNECCAVCDDSLNCKNHCCTYRFDCDTCQRNTKN